jgi:aspartate kinase
MEKVVKIIKSFNQDSNVVAVVSALSSDTKVEGTTSRLLTAAQCAVRQEEFGIYLDRIEDTHLDVIYGLLKSRELREEVRAFVQDELHQIREFCTSLGVIRELSARSHDMVIGCGERLSAGLISGILRDEGLDSVYVNLSKAFGSLDTSKRGYQHDAKQILRSRLVDLVSQGKVPVVTGFFGDVNGGIINGVGRGYTDLTSALCAGALDAKALQVWKESDGVFTGNPTKIDDARLLSLVTPEEAAELTYFGNEVRYFVHESILGLMLVFLLCIG